MEEHKLAELIDQYLLGTISVQDKAYLDQRVKTEPEIAELVKESKQAFRVLQAEQKRRLREKLRELDKRDTRWSAFWKKWFFIAIGLLIAIYFWWHWAAYYYNPTTIARRYFERDLQMEKEMYLQEHAFAWEVAQKAFRHEEYETAILHYEPLKNNAGQPGRYFAEWNILLSQLAGTGATEEWKMAMEQFAQRAPYPLQNEATKLLGFLDSAFYRLLFARVQTHLPPIKPRLI
jgi:hypothetical protein